MAGNWTVWKQLLDLFQESQYIKTPLQTIPHIWNMFLSSLEDWIFIWPALSQNIQPHSLVELLYVIGSLIDYWAYGYHIFY